MAGKSKFVPVLTIGIVVVIIGLISNAIVAVFATTLSGLGLVGTLIGFLIGALIIGYGAIWATKRFGGGRR